jgi:hypothetical protein
LAAHEAAKRRDRKKAEKERDRRRKYTFSIRLGLACLRYCR